MEHNPPPNIKEDHKVWITLNNNEQVFSVPCKIFLPKTVLEYPQVYIFPDRDQFKTLPRLKGKFRLETTDNNHPFEIICEDTHISGGTMHHWGEGLEEGYLKIYPSRLIIKHRNTPSSKNLIWFRLTPSFHLSPLEIRTTHYDGSAEINSSKQHKFEINDDFILTFKKYYRWNKIGNDQTVNFSELYAEAEFKEAVEEDHVENYISMVDDFLLLVSLAEGRRITLPQLTVYYPDYIVDIYRMDRSMPENSQSRSPHQLLIDTREFKLFLKSSWGILKESHSYNLLKSALAVNTDIVHHTMESRFLSLFSSIETILLAFKSENRREYVVPDQQEWNKIKKKIIRFIKANTSPSLTKEERKLLYSNIDGLNRIPLHDSFEAYLKKHDIYCDDLWNFFGENSEYPLTKIRNRLVHGHSVNEHIISSFSMALDNLDLYASRLILASLGWNPEQSNVYRRDDSFIEKWKDARERIKEWS